MRRGEHSINLLFFKTPGVGLHPKSRETTSLKRNREIRRETRKRVRTETGGDSIFYLTYPFFIVKCGRNVGFAKNRKT